MDSIERLFRDRGLKVTIQRRIVMEILEAATDHPCADEIYRRAARERPVPVATIYRVLGSLVEAGLVTRHVLDGKARFERIWRRAHPHLIDLDRGTMIEVDDEGLAPLIEDEARRLGFRLIDYRLRMYGKANKV